MAELEELKKIKKIYGENFMKMCRTLFPTLLEEEGLLYSVLTSNFSNNARSLYEDIHSAGLEDKFKEFVYNKVDVEGKKKQIIVEKTPYKLLDEAGYDLYECSTEEEIQSFKKYYKEREELCTFNGGRLDRCVVFFAVKKNAEEIKREDFNNPKREDEYGTSVMGIQFEKHGLCTVSIKNRYNHTVNNPDATYGNDLDRIAPGLKQSFAKLLLERGLNLNSMNIEQFEIPGYVVAGDGKYYKYNMEINGKYYCPGNVIIDGGKVVKLEPEKQLLIDNFVVDLKDKSVKQYDYFYQDSFEDGLCDIEKIEILKDKKDGRDTRIINITRTGQETPIQIRIDHENKIIGYRNDDLIYVDSNFLASNETLEELVLPSLQVAEGSFLVQNKSLRQVELPNLEEVGDNFIPNNHFLKKLDLPRLKKAGADFLRCNNFLFGMHELKLPALESVSVFGFLEDNLYIDLELPNLKNLDELRKPWEKIDGFEWRHEGELQQIVETNKVSQWSSKILAIIPVFLKEL